MNVGIIGLGLMGGTIAKALKGKFDVVALDINQEAINYAIREEIIKRGTTSVVEYARVTDLSFVCLYPDQIPGFFQKNQALFASGHRFIEISGIKTNLYNRLKNIIRKDVEMIYTHPIAGREKKGLEYSDSRIFQNANFIVCPTQENNEESISFTERLAKDMGFKTISRLTMEEHDRIIAYTSQLTHVLSLALVGSDDNHTETSRYIGDSYRDLTRISMINEDLWSELFVENKANLLDVIDRFSLEMAKYRKLIEDSDIIDLKQQMQEVKERRISMEKGEKK